MKWCLLLLWTLVGVVNGLGNTDCYGDFMKLTPTGAGQKTAAASRLPYTGVRASEAIARLDLEAVKSLRYKLLTTGSNICIHPALIAGLASRESNAGKYLRTCNGWGDCHAPNCQQCRGWGIFQCDVISSGIGEECKRHAWDSQALMELTLSKVLVKHIECVQKKHTDWSKERQLQGGIAAYNFGCSNVWTWGNLDGGSTNDDYSNDVVARAQWFFRNVQW